MSDPFQDPEWLAYAEHARDTLIPMLADSEASVALMPDDVATHADIKFMLETGAALCLGTPIILVVQPGSNVPAGLARAADAIIEWPRGRGPDSADELRRHISDALDQIAGEAGEHG